MANAGGEKKRDKAMFRKKQSFALGTGGKIFDSDIKKAELTASSKAKKERLRAAPFGRFFSSDIIVLCAKDALFGEFDAL